VGKKRRRTDTKGEEKRTTKQHRCKLDYNWAGKKERGAAESLQRKKKKGGRFTPGTVPPVANHNKEEKRKASPTAVVPTAILTKRKKGKKGGVFISPPPCKNFSPIPMNRSCRGRGKKQTPARTPRIWLHFLPRGKEGRGEGTPL